MESDFLVEVEVHISELLVEVVSLSGGADPGAGMSDGCGDGGAVVSGGNLNTHGVTDHLDLRIGPYVRTTDQISQIDRVQLLLLVDTLESDSKTDGRTQMFQMTLLAAPWAFGLSLVWHLDWFGYI